MHSLAVAALFVVALAVLFLMRDRRTARVIVAVVAMTLAVVVGLQFARGSATTTEFPEKTGLRILSWNTNQDSVDAFEIIRLIALTDPDIVVLPEYFDTLAYGRLSGIGGFDVLGDESSAASLLISDELGHHSVRTAGVPPWAGFVAATTDPSAPHIVVTHLQAPSFSDVALWNEHLDWAASECTAPSTILIGDFNATLANLGSDRLGECVDAAATLGASATGTWPTLLPPALGTQIDHVFASSDWTPTYFGVVAGFEGSDHRPIVVDLVR